MTWDVSCKLRSGEQWHQRFYDATLKQCRTATYAAVGRHNIVSVALSDGKRLLVYDHFPLRFNQPQNNKGQLRLRLSRLSAELYENKLAVVSLVTLILANYGLTLGPVVFDGRAGSETTGVLDGTETIDHILFEWKATEYGNYDFSIHLI